MKVASALEGLSVMLEWSLLHFCRMVTEKGSQKARTPSYSRGSMKATKTVHSRLSI